jgi:hypothetical protein
MKAWEGCGDGKNGSTPLAGPIFCVRGCMRVYGGKKGPPLCHTAHSHGVGKTNQSSL